MTFPFYAILLAIFFPLSYVSHNLGNFENLISPTQSLQITFYGFCFYLFWFFIFKPIKSLSVQARGLIAAFGVFIIFLYGHLFEKISQKDQLLFDVSYYFVAMLVLIFLVQIQRRRPIGQKATYFLNIFSVILIAQVVIQILQNVKFEKELTESTVQQTPSNFKNNVYFILLDGYASFDVLQTHYNLDNSEFKHFLEEKGFYVNEDTYSNYGHTWPQMITTLNMDYLGGKTTRLDYRKSNQVALQFKNMGYHIIEFRANPNHGLSIADKIYPVIAAEDLVAKFLKTTMFRRMISTHYNDTLRNSFDKMLANASEIDDKGPYYAYIHITPPHPPYLHDENGNAVNEDSEEFNSWQNKPTYVGQLKYLNSKIEQLVTHILERDKSNPIIIIQSDHGTASEFDVQHTITDSGLYERLSVLNALRIPGQTLTELPFKTLVNTFRFLFSTYYHLPYPLIEDVVRFDETLGSYKKQKYKDYSDIVFHFKGKRTALKQ